jgi:adenylate cyclase
MSEAARILVVDDEPDVEQLITQRFRREIRAGEFAFSFAYDGAQALARLQQDGGERIELMLLDINMPVMDGLTLLSRLREMRAPVRAIIVSAYGDMPNIRTAMNRGAFDFVTKPIDLADLEVTMRKTLEDVARLRETERRRAAAERARGNLARYFSPNLVGLLAERDEPFGPIRRQDVAVLFADIVGFTTISEEMPPERVIGLLREFHRRMTACIFACGGTVEKYIGDAMLATFGVPETGACDACDALRCADLMLAALDDWNRERAAGVDPPLAMGIGLNYGSAVIGDVGSERSMSFTVVGDTVNTASRIQTLTRALATPLLASDALVREARRRPHEAAADLLHRLVDAGEQALRGRQGVVRVWRDPARTAAPDGDSHAMKHRG